MFNLQSGEWDNNTEYTFLISLTVGTGLCTKRILRVMLYIQAIPPITDNSYPLIKHDTS